MKEEGRKLRKSNENGSTTVILKKWLPETRDSVTLPISSQSPAQRIFTDFPCSTRLHPSKNALEPPNSVQLVF